MIAAVYAEQLACFRVADGADASRVEQFGQYAERFKMRRVVRKLPRNAAPPSQSLRKRPATRLQY